MEQLWLVLPVKTMIGGRPHSCEMFHLTTVHQSTDFLTCPYVGVLSRFADGQHLADFLDPTFSWLRKVGRPVVVSNETLG